MHLLDSNILIYAGQPGNEFQFAPAGSGSDMFGRRMPAEHGFERTNDLMLRAVESQRIYRRPSGGGDSHGLAASPAKVMVPLFVARVEQPHHKTGRGIARRLPCSFAQRAMDAGQRQIRECCGASGHHGHHMIHMKGGSLSEVRESAVFAAVSRTRHHAPTETGGHSHCAMISRL